MLAIDSPKTRVSRFVRDAEVCRHGLLGESTVTEEGHLGEAPAKAAMSLQMSDQVCPISRRFDEGKRIDAMWHCGCPR